MLLLFYEELLLDKKRLYNPVLHKQPMQKIIICKIITR